MAVNYVTNNTKYKATRSSHNGIIKKGDIITKQIGMPANWSEYLMEKEVNGKMKQAWMYTAWLDIASDEDITMSGGGLYPIF